MLSLSFVDVFGFVGIREGGFFICLRLRLFVKVFSVRGSCEDVL